MTEEVNTPMKEETGGTTAGGTAASGCSRRTCAPEARSGAFFDECAAERATHITSLGIPVPAAPLPAPSPPLTTNELLTV